MPGEEAILVAVRSRPLLDSDACPYNSSLKFFKESREVECQERSFNFNFVFPPDATNLDVYTTAVSSRLEYIFNGFNLTIFAYGQTGSGKSHTMGTSDSLEIKDKTEEGIIPLSVKDIFREISIKGKENFRVKASFLEVYKEEVYDLLNKKADTCKIQEDTDGAQKVVNLTDIPVKCTEDVLNVLKKGCQARRTGSTALNEHSSRSHSIFILNIEQNPGSLETIKSKFQLVDLAGSERAEKSKTDGVRFKEGCDINRGLLALGKVISALCKAQSDKTHIPYRDSKLTRLLMDSLGGNSYTLMIACISPSELSSEETLSTLRYASSARNIKNKPVVNVDPPHIQIEKLKRQVDYLQSQLYKKSTSLECLSTTEDSFSLKQQNECLQEKLTNLSTKVAVMSEQLIKAKEKAENLNNKLKLVHHDLQMFVLKQEPNEESAELKKLYDHLKCLEKEYNVTSNLTTGEISNSSEEEVSDDDDEVGSEGDLKKKLDIIVSNLKKKKMLMDHFMVLSQVVECSECTQDDLVKMKNKINELELEKDTLLEKLKTSEKRFADEHKKRYNDCSCEINGLKKKILRNEFMQKIRMENQIKMDKFKQEIDDLKCAKVKLMRKIKADSENLRKLELANKKEVSKLKQNERRKDREILNLRNNLEKQVNVFKQKIERVQSLNKRYKDALSRRDGWSAVNRKAQNIGRENIEELLNKELEVQILRKLAREQYDVAKENMSELAEKVQNIDQAGDPSSSLQDMLNLELEHLNKVKPETRQSPVKKGDHWTVINCMADAKVALEILFNKYISSYMEAYHNNELKASEISSLREGLEVRDRKVEEEIRNQNEKIKDLKEKIERMQEEYERELEKEKCKRDIAVINCLKDVNHLEKKSNIHTTPELLNKLNFQEQEINRLSKRVEDYSKKCEEVDYWKLEYNKLCNNKPKRRKYLSDITLKPSSSSSSSSSTYVSASGSALFEYLDDTAEESFNSTPDLNDPDWRMTPLQKQRKRRIREAALLNRSDDQQEVQNEAGPSKRPFSGCKCPGDCKTKRCSCKKKMQACSISCDCSKEICINKSSEN